MIPTWVPLIFLIFLQLLRVCIWCRLVDLYNRYAQLNESLSHFCRIIPKTLTHSRHWLASPVFSNATAHLPQPPVSTATDRFPARTSRMTFRARRFQFVPPAMRHHRNRLTYRRKRREKGRRKMGGIVPSPMRVMNLIFRPVSWRQVVCHISWSWYSVYIDGKFLT
jgi:hypothetical protein